MQRLSPRFWSQQFFLCKICAEDFPPFFLDLYEDAMLVPIRIMGTNIATGEQQKHLSMSFATEA